MDTRRDFLSKAAASFGAAMTMTPEQLVIAARNQRPKVNGNASPSAKLAGYIDGVTSGKIRRVPLPWPKLDALTFALMPGAMTVLCGDPGAGKTYLMLDCLRFWTKESADVAIYFLEEDDTFYLRRLLAQEEGDAKYGQLDWWVRNPDDVKRAMASNAETIDRLGSCFKVAADLKQMELRQLTAWLENELKSGRRVVVIDPITAANAGIDRWLADDAFVMETKALISRYGASLLLVTHPRKGNVKMKSGHDMGGGAAYFRFSSTTIWLNRLKNVRRFDVYGEHGPTVADTDTVIEIHKARESKGTGQSIAMGFGNGLHFSEYGVIIRECEDAPAGQPEKPMDRADLDKALLKLTQAYPLQLNTVQGDMVRKAFAPFSFATVERVVDAHYFEESGPLDVAKLIARLRP